MYLKYLKILIAFLCGALVGIIICFLCGIPLIGGIVVGGITAVGEYAIFIKIMDVFFPNEEKTDYD